MRKLIKVTRDEARPHAMYLAYSANPVARTKAIGDKYAVNVDYDESGGVVGIEIVVPNDETIAAVADFAGRNELSLLGIFDPETIAV
jgi:uncharacterized protein YuzE